MFSLSWLSWPSPTAPERHAPRPGHPDAAGSAPCRSPRLVQAGLEEGTEATPRRTDVRRTAGKASDELRTAPRAVGFIPNLSKMWQPASERLQVGTAGKSTEVPLFALGNQRSLRVSSPEPAAERRVAGLRSARSRSGSVSSGSVRSSFAPFVGVLTALMCVRCRLADPLKRGPALRKPGGLNTTPPTNPPPSLRAC